MIAGSGKLKDKCGDIHVRKCGHTDGQKSARLEILELIKLHTYKFCLVYKLQ